MRAILLLCALLIASDAYALRCGNRLVRVGDYKQDVLDKCGEPDYTDRHTVFINRPLQLHPITGAVLVSVLVEVEIDEWGYNFGPREFKQLLEFEDDRLIRIQQLGYGY